MTLAACGPEADTDEMASGAGSDSGADTGQDDGSSADGDSGTPSDESGELPDACAPLANESPEGTATVTIRNDTADVLFVGLDGGCQLMPFSLLDGADQAIQWQAGDCAASCEEVLRDECFECGPCGGSPMVRLGPGDEWTREWGGGLYIDESIPAECSAEPCQTACEVRTAAPAGMYGLRTEARSECPGTVPALCECPEGETTCIVSPDGDVPEGTTEATATLEYPSGAATLVFR